MDSGMGKEIIFSNSFYFFRGLRGSQEIEQPVQSSHNPAPARIAFLITFVPFVIVYEPTLLCY